MTHRNLFWPLSIIVIFCLFLLGPFIFNGSTAAPLSQSCSGSPGETAYDACVKATEEACSDPSSSAYTACKATQTAEQRQTDQALGTAFATNTSQPTNTSAPAQPPAAQQGSSTPTSTATRTATSTAAAGSTSSSVTSTPTLSPTLAAVEDLATATPIVEGEICAPGSRFSLAGEGPPNTALVITFDPQVDEFTPTPSAGRAVAGALIDSAGRYRVTLLIGDERPGIYDVRVRVRSSRDVLDTQVCTVPIATPTATPS